MAKEMVKLNDGSEAEINCKHITGRRAFQLGPEILKIKELKSSGKGEDADMSVVCTMNSAVDLCWNHIVSECPQRDQVGLEDMQRIYEKYAKNDIDFVLKKNLENFK